MKIIEMKHDFRMAATVQVGDMPFTEETCIYVARSNGMMSPCRVAIAFAQGSTIHGANDRKFIPFSS